MLQSNCTFNMAAALGHQYFKKYYLANGGREEFVALNLHISNVTSIIFLWDRIMERRIRVGCYCIFLPYMTRCVQ